MMQPNCLPLRSWPGFLCIGLFLVTLASCDDPFSIAMHNPIYPSSSENVTYTLEMLSGRAPTEVKLYERIDNITLFEVPFPFGDPIIIPTIFPGAETLLQTWPNPSIGTLTHVKSSPNPANSLVTYRFEIRQSNGTLIKHEIQYATRDYPLTLQPAPVYVVGDADNTFDVVFIPDTDISNMGTFRNQCRNMIRESFFDENTTKLFRHSFNFYINPRTGHATDYDQRLVDGYHQVPSNNAYLTFAEGRVLMHQTDLRDYASGGLFSTELQNRGTILHESGHSLFGLMDEYEGGAHSQSTDLPNNWSSLSAAQTDAPARGKTAGDAVQIGSDPWWKLCVDNCLMKTSGLTHTAYDRPCVDRVLRRIVDTSAGH